MELRGQLRSWNDQKGFGFIRSEQGGDDVFAHISAMRGVRRPVQGDRVLYLSEPDKGGRLRATHIRLDAPMSLDEPAIRRKPSNLKPPAARSAQPLKPAKFAPRPRRVGARRPALLKLLGMLVLGLLPALGMLQLANQGVYWPVLASALASLLAFGLYLQDKRSAIGSGWRTPEARLHMVELIGGWPGALIAQQLLRHKTRKLSFQLVFWLIVLAHQIGWFDYLYLQRLVRLLASI